MSFLFIALYLSFRLIIIINVSFLSFAGKFYDLLHHSFCNSLVSVRKFFLLIINIL